MSPKPWYLLTTTLVLLAISPHAHAQRAARIGYVYPAGGKQGSTFEAVIAGQLLTDVSYVDVSGTGVAAKIKELIRPITGKETNDLRIQIDELLARKAVVTKDAKALEQFKTFRNAKNIKHESSSDDKELQEIKQKYANATWTEQDEKLLKQVRAKLSSAVRRPANPAISELAVVEFTLAEKAEPGQRELRIGSPTALSNPLVFQVGCLPEFSKPASKTITQQVSAVAKTAQGPKSTRTASDTEVTIPAVVNGQILPGQIDRYRFQATKGQRLVLAAAARQLIPYIADAVPGWFQATLTLYDAKGKELAYDDDFRFDPDPVLYYEIPADGQYVVEIKDAIYRGREDFVYRLTIGEVPFVTNIFPLGGPVGAKTTVTLTGWNLPIHQLKVDDTRKSPGVYPISLGKQEDASNRFPFAVGSLPECFEKEPNSDQAHAQRVAMPGIVNGRIAKPDDCDVFCFEGHAGSPFVAEVYARRLNSPLDSLLKFTDAKGHELAQNDDYDDKGAGLVTHQADSRISVTLPADGLYYLFLRDQQHKGGPDYAYRLRLSPPMPDFELRAVPSTINARAGSSVPLTVYVLRRDGFSGEITLDLKDAPKGFTLSGGRLPANQDQVKITLTMPPTPPKEPVSLKLQGRAKINGREISHPAVPAENMTQAFEYRHLVPSQELKVAVAGRAVPKATVKFLAEMPVKIPAGGTVRVPFSGLAKALAKAEFTLNDAPDGITLKSASPKDDGAELLLACDAARIKPGTKGNLIVAASPRTPATPGKTKARRQPQAPLATLPAIPFEVVAPNP